MNVPVLGDRERGGATEHRLGRPAVYAVRQQSHVANLADNPNSRANPAERPAETTQIRHTQRIASGGLPEWASGAHDGRTPLALVTDLTELQKERNHVHGVVECGYTVFESRGTRYLQLDTYGSPHRKIPGKTSQSIQLNAHAAAQLKALIEKTFPEHV
jgi:hypothetical protein